MPTHLKSDMTAGFNVFLLALPLCLGIAVASQCPPISGLLSAIVGGMVASWFGGARLSIKGPAAGLIVVVLGAVVELGGGDPVLGYKRMLAVSVVAALLQIGIAMIKKATIAEIIPPSVVHGMLAAIGIIIISKQAYVLMGIPPEGSSPLDLLFHLPSAVPHLNGVIFFFGVLAFIISWSWPLFKRLSFIPSSIAILFCVIPLSLYFKLGTHHTETFFNQTYTLGPEFLVTLPHHFLEGLSFPDFSMILSAASLKYITVLTLVGSMESLLTVCAVDALAPHEAPSDLNKDLRSIGVGNLVSAMIGGLPMISQILRSKANIDYGATSEWSNFFQGFFMLGAVVILPDILGLIPLSSLAALLILVGFRLTAPKEFIRAYEIGVDQFILFVSTCIITLATDLLTGVGAGMVIKLIMHLIRKNKLKHMVNPVITSQKLKDGMEVKVEGPFTFLNYGKVKKMMIQASKETTHIVLNLEETTYLDHTVLKKLEVLPNELKGVKVIVKENRKLTSFYNHPLSTKGMKKVPKK